MAPLKGLKPLYWATVFLANILLAPLAAGAPAIESQHVLQLVDPSNSQTNQQPLVIATSTSHHRRLHGRFLHITDLHPDDHYRPHTSTEEGFACHRGHGPAGVFGAETSDCDSPMSLVNATLTWVKENLRDEIDFVVWTGDSARHDSDEEIPRHNSDILSMNRRISDAFLDTFSDEKGLVVPVVPTFGNNDIYPHNILLPGPNDILRTYSTIWKEFIPETQRHSFEFGGWFYVEVIPSKLAVFSLNTMYFFDRNAGVDDCQHPSEPGYKHFEWLAVQLDYLRSRGVKAILMGHVPPARTPSKQLWDESCWQKYTLWLDRYRDVVVGSLYGHMNIDHFLLQDTRQIDIIPKMSSRDSQTEMRETISDDFTMLGSADYLRELRDDWAKLPDPIVLDQGRARSKGHKKGKQQFGGAYAERYQVTLIAPSIVPNYFPSLRVFEYNITGLEETPTWVDYMRASSVSEMPTPDMGPEIDELKRSETAELEVNNKEKKKGKGKKGKKPKTPKNPYLHVPDAPPKDALPGPAYYPQTLTLLGFTQYYANLTYINNDLVDNSTEEDSGASSSGWNSGKHWDKTPKHDKPRPKKFAFQVEYSTFDDKIFKVKDLTVKSFVKLAHTIGQASTKSVSGTDDELEPVESEVAKDEESDEESDEEEMGDLDSQKAGKKKDKNKKKKHKNKKRKARKVWLHFLKHAFVSTRSEEELDEL
ncbi:Endopolyphosphatase [Xylariaceae sp. FL0594]|nr:Endopolyphosphatase [Xylariaceae sp. FL0594]